MKAKQLLALVVVAAVGGLWSCSDDPPPVTDLGVAQDGKIAGDTGTSDKGVPKKDKGPARKDGGVPDLPAGDGPAADAPQTQPDMTQPDAMQPDMLQPDMMQPDMMMPDMLQPDMLQPDAAIPPVKCAITSPARASMLTGSASVTVRGTVSGPLSSLKELKVNGKVVTPSPSGAWSLPMTAKWGLNILTIQCEDWAGRIEAGAQAFHYSTKYYAITPSSPASMAVDQAAVARLYQKAIDDGNRATINDLATILEKVINGTNLDAQIPSTLVSGKVNMPWPLPDVSYSVTKTGKLTYGPFKVSLKARSGGLRISGSTSKMTLPIRAKAGVSVSGTITINNLSLVGDINISKASGKPVSVSVPYMNVNYSSLKVNLSGLGGSILNPIVNGLTSLFKNTITSRFESEIKKAIPGPVKSFVSGFKFSQSFNLPSQLGGKKLSIYSALDTIAFDSAGGTFKLDAAVYGSKGIADGKRGTVASSGTYNPAANSTQALEVGLRYDALNQALGAAWYTGALKQDLSSLVLGAISPGSLPFQLSNVKFEIEALLPPLILPGTAGADLDIGVGDLKINLELTIPGSTPTTIKAVAYVSTVAGGFMSLNSKNEISIQLSTNLTEFEPEIQILSIQGTNVPSLGAISLALKQMVIASLPQLVPSIIQKFPIPSIDLSALGGSYGIPAGTVLKVTNGSIAYVNNHVVVSGQLQ